MGAKEKGFYRPLTEDQQVFMMENMGAGHFHCNKFRARNPRLNDQPGEDLDQAVALGMCRAVSTFEPGKARISTWSAFQVRHAIQEEYRNSKVIKPPPWVGDGTHYAKSPEELATAERACQLLTGGRDGGENSRLGEVADRQSPEGSDLFDLVERLLPKRWAFVVEKVYKDQADFNYIAEALGVSKQRVQQIHERAIERLESLLDPEDF